MKSKVLVYGKAQGWTALGIVDAYLKIYPYATLDDLNKAFPRGKFASAKSTDKLFNDMKTIEKEAHESGDEKAISGVENSKRIHYYITLEDGTDVVFYKIAWGKTSFPVLVEHAKQYGIEVASFEDIGRGKGRGSYEIEYLGGFDTVTVTGNKLVETLMKEFNSRFPYLQLCIFPLSMKSESSKTPVSPSLTIAQARAQAPSLKKDFALDGDTVVKDVENFFIENHGLYVEICYYNKEGKGFYTSGDYDKMTLTDLNKEIEAQGGLKDKWK